MSKHPEITMMAMTEAFFHPDDPPSDRPTSSNKRPAVNRKAPTQSTPEARAVSSSLLLGGSFGTTNIALTAIVIEAPAITKKTTFQLAHWEIIPP